MSECRNWELLPTARAPPGFVCILGSSGECAIVSSRREDVWYAPEADGRLKQQAVRLLFGTKQRDLTLFPVCCPQLSIWVLVGSIVLLVISSRGIGKDPITTIKKRDSMYDKVIIHCSDLSFSRVLFFGVVLALGIEAITVWSRFGLGLQSTRDTELLATMTFGLRIHHGYVGVVMFFIAWGAFANNIGLRNAIWMVGIALIASDVVHHLLVLWPITGSPEFDLIYPRKE